MLLFPVMFTVLYIEVLLAINLIRALLEKSLLVMLQPVEFSILSLSVSSEKKLLSNLELVTFTESQLVIKKD